MLRGFPLFVRHFKSKGTWNGDVIADVCITPIGAGVSVRKHVVAVHEILRKFPGLRTKLHAYGTNVEGDWTSVMEAVRRAHEHLHDNGVVRVSSNMRFGTRTDKIQTLEDKTNNFPKSYSCCVNIGRWFRFSLW